MDPELKQTVICKKIAQLTKVIFLLNSKNDQYEENLQSIVNTYENELDKLVVECNQLLHQEKQLGKSREEVINQQLQSVLESFQKREQSLLQTQDELRSREAQTKQQLE